MRSWLTTVLDRLDGTPQPDGLHGPVPPRLPTDAEASRLWDLAMKLGRELGARIDPADLTPAGPPSVPRAGTRRRKVDVG